LNKEKTVRTTSLKTIYLTIPELKEAITRYIRGKPGMDRSVLYAHLMDSENEWCMDWASEGEEFSISIDGEIKDEI
jgi:hypothetical protein